VTNSDEIFVTFSEIIMDLQYGYKAHNIMTFYWFRHEAAHNLWCFFCHSTITDLICSLHIFSYRIWSYMPSKLFIYYILYFLYMFFHLNKQSSTLTQMMLSLKMVAFKWWRLQFAKSDTGWRKNFFDPFPLHLVPKTSPVKSTSNGEWIALVEMWKNPKKWYFSL